MRPITEVDETIGQIYRSSDGDPVKAVKETLDAFDRLTEKERRRAEEAAAAERERQIAQKQEAKRRRKEARKREDTAVSTETEKSPRQRGNVDVVFDAILRTSGPISNATLADETGLTKEQCGTAANYLFNALHVIDRVKRGVWMRKHEYSAHDMSVDIVSRNLGSIPSELIAKPPATVHTIPSATAAMAQAVTVSEREDMLNETLDLLAPQGFKAAHLPVIENWKQATRALLDALEAGR